MTGAGTTTPLHIVVTGGAGFIGSHLCDVLLARGHQVLAIDDLSLGSRANLASALAQPGFRLEVLDLCDRGKLAAVFAARRFDAVFHLAANSDIRAGMSDPSVDVRRTLDTTLATLEQCARTGVAQFFLASTSAVYGETGAEPIDEDHGPLLPISYYGAAKLAAEAFVSVYHHQSGMRTWVARFPNVVGPRATHGAIFDFLAKLERDPTCLPVLGDGTQCKPYLLVDDLVEAMLVGWQRLDGTHSVFQVGPDSMTTVATLAQEVVRRVAPGARIVYSGGDRGWPGDVPQFSYDTSRLRAVGWSTPRSSDEAVIVAIDRIARERGL
ncbi:MAG: NAD-dependent epimerase/dehydratase family protein [Pseudomonadota bacterium]